MKIAQKPGAKPGVARPRSPAGPRCQVCCDPRLYEITTQLAAGMSQNAAAKKYGFTQQTLWKHSKEHMGAALLEHNLSRPVLDQIRRLNQRTLRILDEAEHGKWRDPAIALVAIRECRHNLELIAKLTGELKSPEAAHEPVRVEIVYIDKQLVVPRASDSEPPSAIESGTDA
jgi:hypothetical protein